jgi:hypothetical protein
MTYDICLTVDVCMTYDIEQGGQGGQEVAGIGIANICHLLICHLPPATYHISYVIYHMSYIIYHVSCIICQLTTTNYWGTRVPAYW